MQTIYKSKGKQANLKIIRHNAECNYLIKPPTGRRIGEVAVTLALGTPELLVLLVLILFVLLAMH